MYTMAVMILKAMLPWVLVMGTAPCSETKDAVFFVAVNGSDSNPGTRAQPWRTIAKASRELGPGDTVYLRAGAYDDIIEPTRSGTAGNKITYARYQDEQVVVRGESGARGLVLLRDTSYIVIDGLALSYGYPPPGGDQRWPWVLMSGGAHHNEIRNCTIVREGEPLDLFQAGYREWGILLKDSKRNTIENNYITGVNQGIHISDGSQYNLIQGNTITDTGQSSIVVGSNNGIVQGNLIQNNLLERSAIEDGIQFMANTDLPEGKRREADISNLGTVIRNNVIRYHNENAIDLKGVAHVVIEDNIIYGCVGSNRGPLDGWNRRAHGTITRGATRSTRDVIIRRNVLYDSAPGIRAHEGYKIYNNTLVGNNRDYTGSNSVWNTSSRPAFSGIRQKEEGTGRIVIQNNIVVGHNTAEVALVLREKQVNANHIDHNLYYNSAGVFFADRGADEVWRAYSLFQWRRRLGRYDTVTGDDRHSLIAYPRFVKAPERPVGEHGQFNFHLKNGSPAIDAGAPLTRVNRSGSGRKIQVGDAGFFFDGFGITAGDLIQIGGNSPVRILSIDYTANTITIDRSVSWEDGDWVTLPYNGRAPDIGAYECEGDCIPGPRRPRPNRLVIVGAHYGE